MLVAPNACHLAWQLFSALHTALLKSKLSESAACPDVARVSCASPGCCLFAASHAPCHPLLKTAPDLTIGLHFYRLGTLSLCCLSSTACTPPSPCGPRPSSTRASWSLRAAWQTARLAGQIFTASPASLRWPSLIAGKQRPTCRCAFLLYTLFAALDIRSAQHNRFYKRSPTRTACPYSKEHGSAILLCTEGHELFCLGLGPPCG